MSPYPIPTPASQPDAELHWRVGRNAGTMQEKRTCQQDPDLQNLRPPTGLLHTYPPKSRTEKRKGQPFE